MVVEYLDVAVPFYVLRAGHIDLSFRVTKSCCETLKLQYPEIDGSENPNSLTSGNPYLGK